MNTLKILSISVAMAASTMLLSACNVVKVHEHEKGHEKQGYGPPPHAPAHGYRYKHRGHTLEYNYDLGVYIVIDLKDHYFIDNNYYKWTKHGWYSSHYLNKYWHKYKKNDLPGNLHKQYGHKKQNDKNKYRENRQGQNNNHHDD